MQYLLTEEEFQSLKDKAAGRDRKHMETLMKVCQLAADNVPIENGSNGPKTPWGCILTVKHYWHCDHCPVQKQCPHNNKSFSQ